MAIYKSSNSGIPFGNTSSRPTSPSTGQPYFNGELQRLELYTGAQYGWQNIVAETPGVTGYTGTISETSGGTIAITGTNFASGALATIVGTDGTEYNATSTTVNNLTSISATFGPASASIEPYDIRVTNPSNLYGVYYDILTINDKPIWTTAAGSLGAFNEGQSVSATVNATDEENNTITYSSSNLPAWLSLDSSTGILTGTAPSVSSNTTYSFNINASDGINTSQNRAFSILINSVVTWNTASGNIGTIYPDTSLSFTYTLSATALANTITSYTITSGSLPTGLSLNSSTGVISGTASAVQSETTFTFTVLASDGTASASRTFNILQKVVTVSGGTLYSDSTYYYRAFTSGTNNLIVNYPITADYLLVAGGGGGGSGNAAGGGAGGLIELTSQSISPATYSIVIGSGGSGASGTSQFGSDGQNSTAFGKTAIGGGGGGWDDQNGRPGGSGGGAADSPNVNGGDGQQPGSASGGYGNRGGNCREPSSNGGGGGGGGAGGAGADVVNNNIDPNQHYGGIGRTSTLINTIGAATGLGHLSSSNYYFAGGGSGSYKSNSQVVPAVAGGGGSSGSNGTSNTGGGGGGITSGTGGSGGSGVFVIRYTKSQVGG
jgi:Putative Ig domain